MKDEGAGNAERGTRNAERRAGEEEGAEGAKEKTLLRAGSAVERCASLADGFGKVLTFWALGEWRFLT